MDYLHKFVLYNYLSILLRLIFKLELFYYISFISKFLLILLIFHFFYLSILYEITKKIEYFKLIFILKKFLLYNIIFLILFGNRLMKINSTISIKNISVIYPSIYLAWYDDKNIHVISHELNNTQCHKLILAFELTSIRGIYSWMMEKWMYNTSLYHVIVPI